MNELISFCLAPIIAILSVIALAACQPTTSVIDRIEWQHPSPVVGDVTLDELKDWLKIPLANTAQDSVLEDIIKAVTRNAEIYTKRDFISKEYKTFRDFFGDDQEVHLSFLQTQRSIQLRRTPVGSIVTVQYTNSDNVLTLVDSSVYYFTETNGSEFSLLQPNPDKSWPSDLQTQRLQNVQINFTAGWAGAAEFKFMWPDLWQALLAHMASVFVNRGDCSVSEGCRCSNAPSEAKSVYNQYCIVDFVV